MRKIIACTALVVSAAGLSGCATVVKGTSQDLAFSTLPEGSTVTVTGGNTCISPCKIKLKRRNPVRVDIAHAGYKPAYVLVKSKWGGATAGNILLGGVIGGVVDGANGASNFLSPNPVKVKFAPEGSAQDTILIDKKGKEAQLADYNDSVRVDVSKVLGAQAAGIEPAAAPAVAPTPASGPVVTAAAATPAH